ncbi:MAG: 3-isopropylmalate dehydratase [Hyphomicrobiales bacterium]
MTKPGRAWVLGDDIDTDVLAPGKYMQGGLSGLAAHCLETVRPEFASEARPGDVLVAGKNFGIGSSREQAAEALRHLGIVAVLARSFGGIFYRNALNLGLPVFRSDDLSEITDGEKVVMDIDAPSLTRTSNGEKIDLEPLPDFLLHMLHDGGLVPHLEKKFKRATPE